MTPEIRAQLIAAIVEAMEGFLIEERPERVAEAVIDALLAAGTLRDSPST